MFVVEIKADNYWHTKKLRLIPGKWTPAATCDTKEAAEKEFSWLDYELNNYKHLIQDINVEYRLLKEGQVIWDKKITY